MNILFFLFISLVVSPFSSHLFVTPSDASLVPLVHPQVVRSALPLTEQTVLVGHLPQNRYRSKDLSQLLGGDVPVETNIYPKDLQTPLEMTARAVYAFDVKSGYPYFSKNAGESLPLASVTKLVTAYRIALEKPTWAHSVSLTEEDRRGGGGLKIPEGDTVTVEDMWYATLVGSANNAAAALVRTVAGEEAVFVDAMNRWVQNQGLVQTRFTEVTGLSPDNVSTAQEIGMLSRLILYQEDIFRALRTPAYTVTSREGNRVRVTSTNQLLLAKDPIVVVGKTGFIEEAGYNFISLGTLHGHEIITVLLGAESLAGRFSQTQALYQWIDQNYLWEEENTKE